MMLLVLSVVSYGLWVSILLLYWSTRRLFSAYPGVTLTNGTNIYPFFLLWSVCVCVCVSPTNPCSRSVYFEYFAFFPLSSRARSKASPISPKDLHLSSEDERRNYQQNLHCWVNYPFIMYLMTPVNTLLKG